MNIKELKWNSKTNCFELKIDNYKNKFLISYEFVNKIHLNLDTQIDEQLFKEINKESKKIRNKIKVLKFALSRRRTENEIKFKFKSNNISNEESNKIISQLKNSQIINDNQFAIDYLYELKHIKRLSIKASKDKMFQKRIPINIINKTISSYTKKEEYENLIYLLNMKNYDYNIDNIQKIIRKYINKGFNYETIKKAINELK